MIRTNEARHNTDMEKINNHIASGNFDDCVFDPSRIHEPKRKSGDEVKEKTDFKD
jgi:hypothetical protein